MYHPRMEPPRIQYATTSDGVSIAYADTGEGHPLIFVPGVPFSHVQLAWDVHDYHHQVLANKFRFIRYDPRGCGLSDRPATDFSMEAMLRDFEAVRLRTGVERFALWSNHFGVPIALTVAAQHASSVTHVVVFDGWANYRRYPLPAVQRAAAALRRMNWELYTETWGRAWGGYDEELAKRYGAFARACCDGETCERALRDLANYNAEPVLADILAPTLVVQIAGHSGVPEQASRDLASALRFGELVLVDDPSMRTQPELIEQFIARQARDPAQAAPGPAAGGFRTILFTDLEASTPLTERLGDEKAQEIVRGHNEVVRTALKAHGGEEVKHTGDGIMASFASAVSAVRAALQVQRALAAGEVRVRIGMNAGEPIAEEGDYFGSMVQLAARVCDRAEPGQVVVTQVVRDLCRGKGFAFEDLGPADLKGFAEPERLFAVRERA